MISKFMVTTYRLKLFLVSTLIVTASMFQTTDATAKPPRTTSGEPLIIEFPENLASSNMPFLSHTGLEPFDNALALNVTYERVKYLRPKIERATGRKLKIFQGWNPEGEAHVTVITPPEFANILSRFLTMKDIEIIAQSEDIQKADLTVYGIGSGKKQIDGKEEETFFLIVDSMRLRSIRHKIWKSYVKKGGSQDDWDPTWFFPHVTIGFTKQDIHEPDIIKNIRSSHDKRFRLTLDKN